MKIRVDIVSALLWYVGYAVPGTPTSAALWRVVQITFDASGNFIAADFANGTAEFTNVYDDRAGYSYS